MKHEELIEKMIKLEWDHLDYFDKCAIIINFINDSKFYSFHAMIDDLEKSLIDARKYIDIVLKEMNYFPGDNMIRTADNMKGEKK